MIFIFKSSGLEVKVKHYEGAYGHNDGVAITMTAVSTKESSKIKIEACKFATKGKSRNKYQSADDWQYLINQDVERVNAINKLIELIEVIQKKLTPSELKTLEEMNAEITQILTKAAFNLPLEQNPYQYIIPGKRMDESTFDMVEVMPAQTLTNFLSSTNDTLPTKTEESSSVFISEDRGTKRFCL